MFKKRSNRHPRAGQALNMVQVFMQASVVIPQASGLTAGPDAQQKLMAFTWGAIDRACQALGLRDDDTVNVGFAYMMTRGLQKGQAAMSVSLMNGVALRLREIVVQGGEAFMEFFTGNETEKAALVLNDILLAEAGRVMTRWEAYQTFDKLAGDLGKISPFRNPDSALAPLLRALEVLDGSSKAELVSEIGEERYKEYLPSALETTELAAKELSELFSELEKTCIELRKNIVGE